MSIIDRINKVSIYSYMILFLFILGVAASFTIIPESKRVEAWMHLIIVPIFASAIDSVIKYVKTKTWAFSKTGMISGLFIANILDPGHSLAVLLIAAVIAILSKHLIRLQRRNLLNPAGFGITVTGIVFTFLLGTQVAGSWWGGGSMIPFLTGSQLGLLAMLSFPLGLYVSYRIGKLPQTFAFMAAFALLTLGLNTLNKAPTSMAEIIDPGIFFFASFMLVEPKTTPYTLKAMLVFGAAVAIITRILFALVSAPIEYTLIALMLMNIIKDVLDEKLPDPE